MNNIRQFCHDACMNLVQSSTLVVRIQTYVVPYVMPFWTRKQAP